MQRFFFHLYNRIGFVRDGEGRELSAIEDAREQARRDIRSILSEEAKQGVIDLTGRLEIASEEGQVIAIVPFSQAVELRLEGDTA